MNIGVGVMLVGSNWCGGEGGNWNPPDACGGGTANALLNIEINLRITRDLYPRIISLIAFSAKNSQNKATVQLNVPLTQTVFNHNFSFI